MNDDIKTQKLPREHSLDPEMLQTYITNGVNAQTTAKGYKRFDTARLANYVQECLPAEYTLTATEKSGSMLELKFSSRIMGRCPIVLELNLV